MRSRKGKGNDNVESKEMYVGDEKCHIWCRKHNAACAVTECRYWIKSESNLNCTMNAIYFAKGKPIPHSVIAEMLEVSVPTIVEDEKRGKDYLEKKMLNSFRGSSESEGDVKEAIVNKFSQ